MVSKGETHQRHRCSGRFYGRRVNCEHVPALPAPVVQIFLDDPRKIPYLLVWKRPEDDSIREIVRIAREPSRVDPSAWTGWIEIKRPEEELGTYVQTLDHSLPRNGGKVQLLVCPECQAPRRALYGWRPGGTYTTSAERWRWQCRKCLGLRYSSEGGALAHHRRGAVAQLIEFLFNPLTAGRSKPWYPHVFTGRGVCFNWM